MLVTLMLGVRKFKGKLFEEMRHIFERLSTGQDPDTYFVACYDSRLVLPLITQSEPGEFVSTRNVGNIIPRYTSGINSSEASAIEHAVKSLGVKHIIVCGHSDCGAMKGLLDPNTKARLPIVSSWLAHSQSILDEVNKIAPQLNDKDRLELLTKKNIIAQLDNLKTHPSVAEKLAEKKINLCGWYYDVASGEVSVYDPLSDIFDPFEVALQKSVVARRTRIVEDVAMRYLSPFTHPTTAQEYQKLMFCLNQNLYPIWNEIGAEVKQRLWGELGGLYTSESDPAFIALVEQGPFTKLDHLKDFQKNIQESQGYYLYCSQVIKRSGLFSTAKSTEEYQQMVVSEIALGSSW